MTIAVTVLLTLGFSASLFGQQPLASTKEILKEQQAAIAAADQKAVDSLIDGACFVEVYKPEGIVVGIPGAAFQK